MAFYISVYTIITLELVRTARFDGASLARITINSTNAQNNDHFIAQIAQNNDHFIIQIAQNNDHFIIQIAQNNNHFIIQIAQNNDHFIIQIAQNNVVTISSLARMADESQDKLELPLSGRRLVGDGILNRNASSRIRLREFFNVP